MASFLIPMLVAASVAVSDVPSGYDGNVPPFDPQIDGQTEVAQAYGNCMRAAQQAQAMTGGEVLSVVPARNGRPVCRVTVLVINARGRPKRIRLRIPMDF